MGASMVGISSGLKGVRSILLQARRFESLDLAKGLQFG